MNAYEDQCTPANPRMPMVKDMEDILRKFTITKTNLINNDKGRHVLPFLLC